MRKFFQVFRIKRASFYAKASNFRTKCASFLTKRSKIFEKLGEIFKNIRLFCTPLRKLFEMDNSYLVSCQRNFLDADCADYAEKYSHRLHGLHWFLLATKKHKRHKEELTAEGAEKKSKIEMDA